MTTRRPATPGTPRPAAVQKTSSARPTGYGTGRSPFGDGEVPMWPPITGGPLADLTGLVPARPSGRGAVRRRIQWPGRRWSGRRRTARRVRRCCAHRPGAARPGAPPGAGQLGLLSAQPVLGRGDLHAFAGAQPDQVGLDSATMASTLNSSRPTGSVGSRTEPPKLSLTSCRVRSSMICRASSRDRASRSSLHHESVAGAAGGPRLPKSGPLPVGAGQPWSTWTRPGSTPRASSAPR
jgi:hypothetical protein